MTARLVPDPRFLKLNAVQTPEPVPEKSIWQRLGANRTVNAPAFQAARIEIPNIEALHCPSCELEESALFWTQTERTPTRLKLSCPSCGREGASYDLRRNKGRAPFNGRRLVKVAIVGLVLILAVTGMAMQYGPDGARVDLILDQAWRDATAAAGDARQWLANLVRRIR